MRREEVLLAESIQRTLDEAHAALVKVHKAHERSTPKSVDDPEDHDVGDAEELFSFFVEKAFRDTAILAERLHVPQFAAQIRADRLSRKDLAETVHTHHDWLLHAPALASARAHFLSLRTMTDVAATTVQDVLATMLKNTAKVIAQKGLKPESEAVVRGAMLEFIRLAFEDARREVSIPKLLKTYRADIGIPSLRTVIEYKYVKSEVEMKACLEGIYADMRGYGGDDSWRTFYAVFYMTDPFFRQDEVEEEFALVRADLNWTPILVVGPGASK